MQNDAKKLAGSHAENDKLFQKTLVKIEAIHIFVAIQLNIFSSPSISLQRPAGEGKLGTNEKTVWHSAIICPCPSFGSTLSSLSAFKN